MKTREAQKALNLTSESRQSEAAERNRAIGSFFHRYRMTLGLSVEQVAREIGVESETLLAYEAGARSASLDEIIHLTILLNIPPEEVLQIITDLYTKLDI
jgi:transcriptional regulator with XRE-family HTH domain